MTEHELAASNRLLPLDALLDACSLSLTVATGKPLISAPRAMAHQNEQVEGRARWVPPDDARFGLSSDDMICTMVMRIALDRNRGINGPNA